MEVGKDAKAVIEPSRANGSFVRIADVGAGCSERPLPAHCRRTSGRENCFLGRGSVSKSAVYLIGFVAASAPHKVRNRSVANDVACFRDRLGSDLGPFLRFSQGLASNLNDTRLQAQRPELRRCLHPLISHNLTVERIEEIP